MSVVRVANQGSPPAVLLQESFREDGKVKNRALADLSRWPEDKIEAVPSRTRELVVAMICAHVIDTASKLAILPGTAGGDGEYEPW